MTERVENPTRVVCAMSGGVDSSVAAALLKEQGHEVIGITMQIWPDQGDNERACCALSAAADARRVAHALGIPHYVLNLQDAFREAVIDHFIAEYRAGRTPNPCIRCNRWIKFDLLLARARELGATHVATGHYAQVIPPERGRPARTCDNSPTRTRWYIRRGVDRGKDQSYALYDLTQEQLAATLLPLGELTKARVREIAADLGMRVAQKPESQDICFVPDNDYGRFLREQAPDVVHPGAIRDTSGRVVGAHEGVAFYTVGQRRRLHLAGNEPRYVVALNAEENEVVVGTGEELMQREVIADDVALGKFDEHLLRDPQPVTAMLRYKMTAQPAMAQLIEGRLHVTFTAPQRAVTPGQALVCYDGDDVACGGVIAE